MVFAVCEGLGRGHGDGITGVNPHGIQVFDAADDHHVVGGVSHHLQLKFFPAQQRLFHQDLLHGAGLQPAFAKGLEFLRVVGNATAGAAEGEGRPNDQGVGADLCPHGQGFLQVAGNAGGAHGHADATHGLLKQVTVFGHVDCLEVGADQFDAKTLKGAVFSQGHGQVQGRLAAHGGQ